MKVMPSIDDSLLKKDRDSRDLRQKWTNEREANVLFESSLFRMLYQISLSKTTLRKSNYFVLVFVLIFLRIYFFNLFESAFF